MTKTKITTEEIDRKKLYPDPKYTGVRRRYAGKVLGLGDDWIFYMQYRDKRTNRVLNKKVGKLSEGWTAKKVALLRDKTIYESQIDKEQTQFIETSSKRPEPYDFLSVNQVNIQDVTVLDIWNDYVFMNQDRDKRLMGRLYSLFKHLKPFHNVNPKDITTKMIQDLRFHLEHKKNTLGKRYAPKSVLSHLKLLQTLINYGIKRGLCTKDPNLYFEMPKIDNQVTEFLTDEQLIVYKKALAEDRDKIGAVFITIALYTGMRKKAIINLKWKDIDYDKNQIILRGEVAKNGKTNYIPLPHAVKDAISTLPHTSEYLFTGKDGKKPREDFKRIAQRLKEKAGLPENFRPTYMLRHNFATHLASSGKVDLYTIQRLMTHESPQMTQRYAHLMDKTLKEGSRVIEDLFSEQEQNI